MQVLKFGGSSVADATRMSNVLDIVGKALEKGKVVLVSSAISGCTDTLIGIGKTSDPDERKVLAEPLRQRHHEIIRRLFTGSERQEVIAETDALFEQLVHAPDYACVTYGELFSTRILARKFACDGVAAKWIDSRELIHTVGGVVDVQRSYADIRQAAASDDRLFVAPGFIASDECGNVTTLGRGGSDYSAALYAAALDADVLEIWTDVPGIMTTNPKVVPSAVSIPYISYSAALSLAENGAKVLYAPTVRPAQEAGIAISIKNTFDPRHPGTIISDKTPARREQWMGVTSLDKEDGISVICLVGEAVGSRKSASGRIVSALSEAGIKALSEVEGESSEFFINTRTLVVKEAVAAIHREFFEHRNITAENVFIAGYGAVGKALVEMISLSAERMAERLGRNIRIVGVADSRRYVIDLRGIRPDQVADRLSDGEDASGAAFIDAVCAAAPRKSVFVDCTGDPDIFRQYEKLFRSGLSIVTSNRRSLAVPYVQYSALKSEARENGAFFRYSTTVANSLPVLESLASGANCSDGIESIEALVSCTLNYVISNYDGTRSDSLASLLKKAHDEGLTEKDPRIDLGGRDVLLKLLILAREAGIPLEEEDVEITPMLGQEFFGCPLDEFYARLSEYEPQFIARENELDELGQRQRFIASVRRDPSARRGYKAEIRMQLVGMESPFYWVNDTENVIIVHSEYSAPLVIKGAGEGARLAASGIIKDILS